MKKIILTVIAAAISYSIAYPQSCLPEGITFTTQTQIDNFQINYPGCIEIEGNVLIHGSNINNLNGLNVVTYIGGYLEIYDLDGLVNLTGLEGLTSIGGYIRISYNDALTSLTGLENLTSVEGGLFINTNNVLPSLSGLEGLTFNGGSLDISYNNNLSSLSGLQSLISNGGTLWIQGNYTLASLAGLDNINAESIMNLYILVNELLSICDVKSICDYLASPNGTINISGNADGCSSQDEVEAACLTPVEEINNGNGITIIPNPSNDKITISSSGINRNTELYIFNVNGEKVIEKQLTNNETLIDINALTRGVYFVRLQNEKMVEVGKMVKE